MTKELLDLGLITADEVANQVPLGPLTRSTSHGTSHFIADVHDGHGTNLSAGHVFTVNRIYIREETLVSA